MKGLFITIEGNDGSGKSTVISALKKEIEKLNIDVVYSREPGGSYVAEKIREVIGTGGKVINKITGEITINYLKIKVVYTTINSCNIICEIRFRNRNLITRYKIYCTTNITCRVNEVG